MCTTSRLWVFDCNVIDEISMWPLIWRQIFDKAAILIKPKPIKNLANIFEFVVHDEPHLKNRYQLWKNLKSTNRNLKQLFRVLAT